MKQEKQWPFDSILKIQSCLRDLFHSWLFIETNKQLFHIYGLPKLLIFLFFHGPSLAYIYIGWHSYFFKSNYLPSSFDIGLYETQYVSVLNILDWCFKPVHLTITVVSYFRPFQNHFNYVQHLTLIRSILH